MNIQELTAAIEKADREGPVKMEVSTSVLVCVVAALQLACRHPNYVGPSREVVVEFTNQVINSMPPELAAMLMLGWNCNLDTITRAE